MTHPWKFSDREQVVAFLVKIADDIDFESSRSENIGSNGTLVPSGKEPVFDPMHRRLHIPS